MGFLDRLSGRKRPYLAGPVIFSLYDELSPDNRAALRESLSGAPSGSEIVAAYKNAPDNLADLILKLHPRKSLPGPGVIGAAWVGDRLVIYVVGDFPEDAVAGLAETLRGYGAILGRDVRDIEVASGRFGPDELKELP